ncbi:hypothetical protein EW093_01680 [Thiospirochaeta perfilievii]|uniref:Uncharacterized protein n=1 Tax=Thiospirochaeta perfilievii TaxID=252967 RepID=A0A5C1Q9J9_9SPIO|nr:DUF5692 family protein [Thiospirochaeta perfilievii]QEN03466.1 hypothetical protein EW093_01680 [Thiospirochaeta perfilievii]
MGLFYEGYTFGSIITLLIFIGFWVGINEVARRSKLSSIIIFCVLPVVMALLVFIGPLGSPTGKTWFGWVKVISALIGVYGFLLIRFTKLGGGKFATIFPGTILSLNIAEAIFREFEVYATYATMTTDAGGIVILGGYWNILNGIAGILTIVTLTGFVGIKVSKSKSKDMIWPDMTWLYIWGYTLWNFAYVYNCISTRSMYAGFAILIAAVLAEYIFKRGAWLQHRAQILVLYAIFSLSFDYQSSELFQIVPVYKPIMWQVISIISITFNLGVFSYMIYTIVKRKKNPLTQEIYGHTKYFKKAI